MRQPSLPLALLVAVVVALVAAGLIRLAVAALELPGHPDPIGPIELPTTAVTVLDG